MYTLIGVVYRKHIPIRVKYVRMAANLLIDVEMVFLMKPLYLIGGGS
jgi:hypothetical protein